MTAEIASEGTTLYRWTEFGAIFHQEPAPRQIAMTALGGWELLTFSGSSGKVNLSCPGFDSRPLFAPGSVNSVPSNWREFAVLRSYHGMNSTVILANGDVVNASRHGQDLFNPSGLHIMSPDIRPLIAPQPQDATLRELASVCVASV